MEQFFVDVLWGHQTSSVYVFFDQRILSLGQYRAEYVWCEAEKVTTLKMVTFHEARIAGASKINS